MGKQQDFIEPLGHGIYAIDTGFQRPHFDAAFLVVEAGRALFIDTGTNHAVPRLLAALDELGLARDAVERVVATHVHLDHAGGVGLLMQSLPRARLLAHPRGARHLIDPRALWAGALAVYGDAEMKRSYGRLEPVPAARVDESFDGQVIELAGRPLLVIDTPGHARHHHCIWDERSQGWFTGDTFGLSYREFDNERGPWVLPTSTPVQFEPEAMRASIARMLERRPAAMYLTHYGRVGGTSSGGNVEVERLAELLYAQLDEMVALALEARSVVDKTERHARLSAGLAALYLRGLRAHGCALDEARQLELLAMDIELNAQGLAIWLDKHAPA